MAVKKSDGGSVIGPGLRVTGGLKTSEPLSILGSLDGNIQVEGAVDVGPTGRVRGDVHAHSVSVEGRIDGNVVVEERVELKLTGRIRGDIVAPRVQMVDGSFFRGRLTTAGASRTRRA